MGGVITEHDYDSALCKVDVDLLNFFHSCFLATSPSSAWPTNSLDNRAMPSPPLVAMDTSTSPRPIPSSAIPSARPDDSLKEFLDKLGLSNYLVLFQVNYMYSRLYCI